jgi:hypothetical protein
MELNSDFIRRAVMHGARLDWVASPIAGIDRRMLDRVGAEVARATTIVRYAPDSQFSAHVHSGGEEILVLDGVFQDEHGDFPAGSYIRNPPQSRYTPGSGPGCTIFTKLWQFDPADRTHVRIDTAKMRYVRPADRPDVDLLPLFRDRREDVRLERWPAASRVHLALPGGGEFLVLEGAFEEAGDTFEPQSWLRLPPGCQLEAVAGPRGCTVWIKTGHLGYPLAIPPAARP